MNKAPLTKRYLFVLFSMSCSLLCHATEIPSQTLCSTLHQIRKNLFAIMLQLDRIERQLRRKNQLEARKVALIKALQKSSTRAELCALVENKGELHKRSKKLLHYCQITGRYVTTQ